MHDGQIIQDEQTEIGQVAKTAKAQLYSRGRLSEDDDMAGVSTLMKAFPTAEQAKPVAKKRGRRGGKKK